MITDHDLKRDLFDVLKKHNCSIAFGQDDCSDTHGIVGEKIELVENGTDKVLLSCDGYCMDVDDLIPPTDWLRMKAPRMEIASKLLDCKRCLGDTELSEMPRIYRQNAYETAVEWDQFEFFSFALEWLDLVVLQPEDERVHGHARY